MNAAKPSSAIASWPQDTREAAQLVVDQYGEPDEITDSHVVWHRPGPWKRIVASRAAHQHNFPVPHKDSVESVIDYRCPIDKVTELAQFDGSVVVKRTEGEVAARCHDEEANFLALNLMHDIATGAKTVDEARHYYAQEFLDYRRKKPTPYMEKLHFTPSGPEAADPDERTLSHDELKRAADEGQQQED